MLLKNQDRDHGTELASELVGVLSNGRFIYQAIPALYRCSHLGDETIQYRKRTSAELAEVLFWLCGRCGEQKIFLCRRKK